MKPVLLMLLVIFAAVSGILTTKYLNQRNAYIELKGSCSSNSVLTFDGSNWVCVPKESSGRGESQNGVQELDDDSNLPYLTYEETLDLISKKSYVAISAPSDSEIEKNQLVDEGDLSFDWEDSEVSNHLTVDSDGSVTWGALTSYPDGCDNGEALQVLGDSISCVSVLSDIGDIPVAAPSSGDTTHLSTADQIYDWVTGLGYITAVSSVTKDSLLDSGTLGFDWSDSELSDTITVGSSASVNWLALTSYPTGCDTGQAVQTIGDTLTCVSIGGDSLWTDGGGITYLTGTSDDVAIGGSTSSAPFYFDVSENQLVVTKIKVGSGANYTTISSSGQLLSSGSATTWDDIRVPITSTRVGGSKDPGFSVFKTDGSGSQGVFTYHFDSSIEEELYFTVQVPHSYKPNTDLHAHLHWSPVNSGPGNVVWGLEYTWVGANSSFSNTTIVSASQPASGTSYQHQIMGIGDISGTGKAESSMLVCRVFRKAGDSSDSYASDAALLEVDFHFEKEKLGTIDEYPN